MAEQLPEGLSVIVPVYNSETILPLLIARLEPVLRHNANRFELILVNDCSKDRSWEVIRSLLTKYDWLVGVNLMRNYSQHNALLCGIRRARYNLIITIDDDLQHPPEEIPVLLNRLAEGFDVVYGTPQKERHGILRDLASRITKMALQGAMGAETARNVSALRAFRTDLRDGFQQYCGPFVSIDVLLTWATTRFTAVPVPHERRIYGKSNYTLGKLLIHALNMMTGFSVWPLQLTSLVGFFFTVFGLVVLLYVLLRYMISGTSVPGFPFLASLIAVFSGAQMFALGIIGEYLARIHFRTMDRPAYVIREVAIPGADPAFPAPALEGPK
jgi:undecaprenyl-phosphate 4-deoxy-4-formamido-L-arabinose transferase